MERDPSAGLGQMRWAWKDKIHGAIKWPVLFPVLMVSAYHSGVSSVRVKLLIAMLASVSTGFPGVLSSLKQCTE
jgi:hypothetical protein